ncbi:uncharacterized protein YjbI with pentapeptide repeats [Neorhizobium galegae]|uniref:pentapeptide repeat-containing protein n=1 Tax=Neorhizobium galegae TaxID=399 RepID=UPI001AE5184A|nr:pentapeptide repeat-containing protein [Neorhizobium galegae]MBP2560355.1 uncharacterized protein YjbI with pentapeptide repeats [Neorhizobium galegae]
MADDIDLQAARSREKDLARRDLKNAHLEGLDLTNVDLTGAHIEQANFSGANLSGATLNKAHTMNADMSHANLSGVVANSTVLFGVNLSGADLRHAKLVSSHFSRVKLHGADLRNANFRNARLNDGTDFTDCVVDDTTIFDGAHILRPLSRQPAFRFYEVERGILVRRPDGPRLLEALPPRAATSSQDGRIGEIERRISELLAALAPLTPSDAGSGETAAGMGHNNPPEPTPLERQEFEGLRTTLAALAVEIHRDDIRSADILDETETLERASAKIADWVGRKVDLAADECAKQLGKSLADARVWMAGWLVVSGKLAALVELLVSIAPN